MKRVRTIAEQEARLAKIMLTPAIGIVLAIVIFPVVINLWISVKPVALGDLRSPIPLARRQVAIVEEESDSDSELVMVRYIMRNSSQSKPLRNIELRDHIPSGYAPRALPPAFSFENDTLLARYPLWAEGYSIRVEVLFEGANALSENEIELWEEEALEIDADNENVLTNFQFTFANYRQIVRSRAFLSSLINTVVYTSGGASGAVLLGLIAALLVNKKFVARGALRVLLLFPYIAPVIAVAFTWQFLLDPLNGFINAMLREFGLIETNIPFLSQAPSAMISVILFDAWRYSPFAYLFILARLQAIPKALYESATVDGAGIMRTFWNITIPQLSGVIGTVFLLRFIWTFNRFDDIFLLTGGAANTKTLPIAVYDNAFGLNDIGGAAATAVLLFIFLSIFLVFYLRIIDRRVQTDA